MADWSSLPSDLINLVAARFLATNDLDHYMDFRAVCHSWRSSTADPRTTTGANDPRFRPRCWVMLDELKSASGFLRRMRHLHDGDDDTRLFVNTTTGRFLRRSLPLLHGYYHVTTTPGGFLVLADRKPPHAAHVLNPFTGAMVRFRAPMPRETYLTAAVVGGSANNPVTLVVACNESGRLYWADPESEAFLFETCNVHRFPSGLLPLLASKYAGRNKHGSSAVTDTDDEATKMVYPVVQSSAQLEHRIVAVSSTGGETTLLVTLDLEKTNHLIQVRKTPAAASSTQGVFEFEQVVTSIGNHALFVGDRCLLVDADKLPSVDANCVYYYQLKGPDEFIFRYDLDAGKAEMLPIENEHPLTLIKLLVNYTMNGPSYELMWDEMLQGIPEDICLPDYELDYDDIFSEFGD